jgi:hypothetical protein
MAFSFSTALRASALLATVAIAHPALADVEIFQTATTDPAALGFDNTLTLLGDGTTDNSHVFGADFTVTSTTNISAIGAAFANTTNTPDQIGTASSGAIFGAIVRVDPTTGLPTQPLENLASITLGEVLFTPTQDGDTTAALSLQLQAGTYGIVFGSGLFGATGVADLLTGEDTVGSPDVFENAFAPFGPGQESDVRLFVDAVPEPASAALLGAGLLLAGLVRRRV